MKRTLYAFAAVLCLASPGAFSQDLGDIQDGAGSLVDTLAKALPFNSTVGLNWSDAYIGQLLGVPPHFGVGVAVGATTVPADKIEGLLDEFGVPALDLPSFLSGTVPLPAAVAEARIGGFLLPFDVGVKAGYLPEQAASSLSDLSGGLNVDYLLAGADLRFALMKGNLLLPRISVGVGFNYMKGGLGTSLGGDQDYSFDDPSLPGTHYLRATSPDVNLVWESKVIDLKAQISKSLLIFTPYLGAGASYGMTTAGYELKSDVLYSTDDVTYNPINQTQIDEIKDALEAAGYDVPDLESTGLSYSKSVTGWAFRAFGGLSVNLLVVRLDLSGLYNFSDGSFGASAGIRVQL